MQVYDRLPPELRDWMAQAALPWSPTSCLRLWRRAVSEEGCVLRARQRMERAEQAMLAREARRAGGSEAGSGAGPSSA